MFPNVIRLTLLACAVWWLFLVGTGRGAEKMATLGTVAVDKYQAQVIFDDRAEGGKSYRVTVVIPKPWDAPSIKGERIDVWLLARGGMAVAVKDRPRGGALVEVGSRGASANALFVFDRAVERGALTAVVVSVDGQPRAFKVPAGGGDKQAAWPPAPKPRADGLPVGQWDVTFADGTTGTRTIKQDEVNAVIKDKWSFAKKPVAEEGAFVIRYEDDRVERWTRVGEQIVVERWASAAGFPSARPLQGVAQKRQPMFIQNGVLVGNLLPDQFVTSVKKRLAPRGPTFVFEVYRLPSYSNFLYRVDICNEKGTLVLQSLEIGNIVPLENDADAFQIVDVDGDGYGDVKVLGGRRDGKPWYQVWLYNVEKRRFIGSEKGS
jgi:hypothetical protein